MSDSYLEKKGFYKTTETTGKLLKGTHFGYKLSYVCNLNIAVWVPEFKEKKFNAAPPNTDYYFSHKQAACKCINRVRLGKVIRTHIVHLYITPNSIAYL